MIDPCHELPVVRQAELLEISRSNVYSKLVLTASVTELETWNLSIR